MKPTMAQLMRLKTTEGRKVEIIKMIATDWKEFGFLMDLDPEGKQVATIEAENPRAQAFVTCSCKRSKTGCLKAWK